MQTVHISKYTYFIKCCMSFASIVCALLLSHDLDINSISTPPAFRGSPKVFENRTRQVRGSVAYNVVVVVVQFRIRKRCCVRNVAPQTLSCRVADAMTDSVSPSPLGDCRSTRLSGRLPLRQLQQQSHGACERGPRHDSHAGRHGCSNSSLCTAL